MLTSSKTEITDFTSVHTLNLPDWQKTALDIPHICKLVTPPAHPTIEDTFYCFLKKYLSELSASKSQEIPYTIYISSFSYNSENPVTLGPHSQMTMTWWGQGTALPSRMDAGSPSGHPASQPAFISLLFPIKPCIILVFSKKRSSEKERFCFPSRCPWWQATVNQISIWSANEQVSHMPECWNQRQLKQVQFSIQGFTSIFNEE